MAQGNVPVQLGGQAEIVPNPKNPCALQYCKPSFQWNGVYSDWGYGRQ